MTAEKKEPRGGRKASSAWKVSGEEYLASISITDIGCVLAI
jgi:hypothetical protein